MDICRSITIKQPERNINPLDFFNPVLILEKLWKQAFSLQMLAQRGERETFRFIRTVVLAGQPFCE